MALIDMAYRIDPSVRVFSIDTGRLPQETHDLVEQLRERYPGLRLELLSPDGHQVQRLVDRHGPNLFLRSVEQRLLCCNVRKVQPLNRALAGLDCWVTGLRRDQWASRTDIRKVEIDHDHDAIVKLNPLAEWTHDEVWDYLRENDVPTHALYERGYTSIGCAPCTRAIGPDEPTRAGPVVVGDRRAEGVRHALLDRDRRLRARAARDPRRGRARVTAVLLKGEELEVARAEVEAVRAAVGESDYADVLEELLGVLAERRGARGAPRRRARPPAHARAPVGPRACALRAGRRAGRAARLPQAPERGRSSRRAPPR